MEDRQPGFLRDTEQVLAEHVDIRLLGDGRYLDEGIGQYGEGIHVGCVQEQDFSLENFHCRVPSESEKPGLLNYGAYLLKQKNRVSTISKFALLGQ